MKWLQEHFMRGILGHENYQTKKGFLSTCKGRFK